MLPSNVPELFYVVLATHCVSMLYLCSLEDIKALCSLLDGEICVLLSEVRSRVDPHPEMIRVKGHRGRSRPLERVR